MGIAIRPEDDTGNHPRTLRYSSTIQTLAIILLQTLSLYTAVDPETKPWPFRDATLTPEVRVVFPTVHFRLVLADGSIENVHDDKEDKWLYTH